MTARRLPILAALLLAMAALVAFGTEHRSNAASRFASLPPPGMPFAPTEPGITTTWFCPGVPASDRRGGDVVVTNPGDVPLRGRLTVFSTAGPPAVQAVQVGVRATATYALENIASGDYLSALVEIDAGIGFTEQRVRHPNGIALQPCSNAPSSNWYLADGLTDQAGYDLVITNPFPDYTNVTVTVETQEGRKTPNQLKSQTMAGRSVLKLDLEEFGLRDEPIVSIVVNASPHRVVVGRAQNYRGGAGRGGYSMTLAAPSLDERWFFPDGDAGDQIAETLTVFNPSEDEAASITLQIFTENQPDDGFVNAEEYEVEPGKALEIDIDGLDGLPDGRHSLMLTSDGVPVVAEQAITRGAGQTASTAVTLGARVRAEQWWVPTPFDTVSENSLVVSNQTGTDGTVTVLALGPGGLLPVAGLEDLPLPAAVENVGGTLLIDLTSEEIVGKPLLIQSSVDVAVGRRPLRGGERRGRTAVLALPAGGHDLEP
jgi:hypothetical protein